MTHAAPPGGWLLRSERLGFRAWDEGDFGLAWGLWGDERVTRRIGGPFAPEQVRERLAREIEMQRSYGVQYWPVFRLAGGQHVGCESARLLAKLGFRYTHDEHYAPTGRMHPSYLLVPTTGRER